MQSFDTKLADASAPAQKGRTITVGRVEDFPAGHSARIALSNGAELALFNVGGEFYATTNFCPHKGAPLTEGILCGHTVECDWHGWQFDVRSGECLTVPEELKRYEVLVEEGWVRVLV
ncbi:MAG TPA: Rieske 2Fe-2S domain-containing protein [Pyrinomonadaceae bacterium]|nr:Rieske 2Fe-2S domain-containing protein [Pyrinomonadaceae bacterium]HLE64071.1 Rieske 2Fe-2S domain-containing protein [Pyrinomonadaceae bacterium]